MNSRNGDNMGVNLTETSILGRNLTNARFARCVLQAEEHGRCMKKDILVINEILQKLKILYWKSIKLFQSLCQCQYVSKGMILSCCYL